MKYFDKAFFKFTFGFLLIIVISLLIIKASSLYAAGIGAVNFMTEEQTIPPNTISAEITMQTQDEAGNAAKTPETIDLAFTSSSPSGEFLNSSGNPVSTTMSKNTSNRTFYYRDSTEGKFIISIKAKGRDSGLEWSTKQNIIISSLAPTSSGGDKETGAEDSNTDSTKSSTNSEGSTANSTHSAPGPLIVSGVNEEFSVLAGGDRLTSVGSPITFEASVKKNTVQSGGISYLWSFGDGSVATGPKSTHAFYYSGNYTVVLNAKAGDLTSIGRFNVKVVEPKVEIENLPDSIVIKNNSATEINLFNWKIINDTTDNVVNGRGFIFPQDTIIGANSSIRIPNIITKLDTRDFAGLVLKDSISNIVYKKDPSLSYNPDSSPEEILANIQKQFDTIKNEAQNMGFI